MLNCPLSEQTSLALDGADDRQAVAAARGHGVALDLLGREVAAAALSWRQEGVGRLVGWGRSREGEGRAAQQDEEGGCFHCGREG